MAEPDLTILMATRNGGRHLSEQLTSFLMQAGVDWALWVSDDGSTDGTWEMLERFRDRYPNREIRLFHGPQRGVAANFLSMLTHPELNTARPVALSDQDDVWLPHRLRRALDDLNGAGEAHPVLYGSRTWVVREDLSRWRLSRRRSPRVSFRNALVQNVVAGNTMVLNPPALDLVRRAARREPGQGAEIPYQDWWIYLLMSGAGGEIRLDEEPGVLYRQHGTNTMGDARGALAGWQRVRVVQRGEYRGWIRDNMAALGPIRHLLTEDNRATLDGFLEALDGPRFGRILGLAGLRIRRETWLGTVALYLAAWTGRLARVRSGEPSGPGTG